MLGLTAKRPELPAPMRIAPALDLHTSTPKPRAKHALLLNPFYAKDPHASLGKHVLVPSLALTSIAASTPPDWTIEYWDENLLQGPPPSDPFPAVVGITVHLTFAKRAYELAAWYRARGAKVVMGGLHVLSCPDEVAPHADAIAVGEGVHMWGTILRDAERGELKARYEGSFRKPYRDDPPPRRDILPRESFLSTASVIATRGCHNRCGFCYLATDGLSMPYQVSDVDAIVNQLAETNEPYAVFVDNNLGSKPKYLRALCMGLRKLDMIWSAAVTVDVADDPSLVREMALGGCTGVFIGFESLTMDNLDDARKKTPRPEDYARRIKIFQDNGIQVNGSFVVGFDHDKPDTFERLARWIEDTRLECATFHILTPYPGTPLFKQMEEENRILHRDWDRYDTAHCVFKPKHMSPEQLEAGYGWLYEYLFSHQSIWRRRPEDLRAVLPYLGMSYLYKRSNNIWPTLIQNRLVHAAWRPLVDASRRRHLKYRKVLATRPVRSFGIEMQQEEAEPAQIETGKRIATRLPVYAGV